MKSDPLHEENVVVGMVSKRVKVFALALALALALAFALAFAFAFAFAALAPRLRLNEILKDGEFCFKYNR